MLSRYYRKHLPPRRRPPPKPVHKLLDPKKPPVRSFKTLTSCRQTLSRCFSLGVDYERGRKGKRVDKPRAANYYWSACVYGHRIACTNVGYFFSMGQAGLATDKKKAFFYYGRGCKRGSWLGCSNLGVLYEQGKGVARSYSRARQLYSKACSRSVGLACSNLGSLYRWKRGVPRDRRRALRLYKRACKYRSGVGCRRAGWMIATGEHHRPANFPAAVELFDRGCKYGNQRACALMRRLGSLRSLAALGPPRLTAGGKRAKPKAPKRSKKPGAALAAAMTGCRLEGPWSGARGVLWSRGRKPLQIGRLKWLPEKAFASVHIGRGRHLRVALQSSRLGLAATLRRPPKGKGSPPTVYLAREKRAARGVLWLAPGFAVRPQRAAGKGRARVGVHIARFRPRRKLRLRVSCGELTLRAGHRPRGRSASWPDGATSRGTTRLDVSKPVAIYAKPGRQRAGRLVRTSKKSWAATITVGLLRTHKGYALIRIRSSRYGIVGWVRNKRLLPTSGGGGLGGLLGTLGRGGVRLPTRRCRRAVALYARRGKTIAPLGWLAKGATFTLRPTGGGSAKHHDVTLRGVKWIALAKGVSFALRKADVKQSCSR